MKKNSSLLIILVIVNSLIILPSFKTFAGRSTGTQPVETTSIYISLALRNYPYIPIFGLDAGNNLNLVADSGVYWLRLNYALLWSEIQPTNQETYNWENTHVEHFETLLREASQRGSQVIITIRSAPEWARKYSGKACGPIKREHLQDFANFAGEVVRRYSQPPYNVKYYHIWNEPDAPVSETDGNSPYGCWGEPDIPYFGGEYYAEMLKNVYPAMKAIDPTVQVILGGLLLYCDPRGIREGYCQDETIANKWNFFEGVVKEGTPYFDVVAFHAHTSYHPSENPVWSEKNNYRWSARGGLVDGKIDYLRDVMGRYGVNKPLIHSEAGLVDGNGSSEFEQAKADYLVWLYARNWYRKIMATTWYTLRGWKGSELVDSSGQPLPAYNAMKTMTTLLDKAELASQESLQGYDKFIFRVGRKEIWLLVPTGETYGSELSLATPPRLSRVLDMFGSEQAYGPTIQFSHPIYLVFEQ